MRRFIDSHMYSSQNWPQEFKDDFIPVLSHCNYYCKDSLMQDTRSIEGVTQAEVRPLPPICETVLSEEMKESLRESLAPSFPNSTLNIFMLSKRCKALKMGTFTLGSEKSKFTTSSISFVSRKNYVQPQLARIQYYLQCTFSDQENVHPIWAAAISFFYAHPCRLWFGFPVEVWSTATTPDTLLVPISSIKCRVVYTESSFDFGGIHGQQKVLVVSPIMSK